MGQVLTPAEAKTKDCSYVTGDPELGQPKCTATECMAWDWAKVKQTNAFLDDVQAHMKKTGKDFKNAVKEVYAEKGRSYEATEGYCSRDGRPANEL